MKKNMMIIGMLVALLTIPTYTFAQEVVSENTDTIPAQTVKKLTAKEKRAQKAAAKALADSIAKVQADSIAALAVDSVAPAVEDTLGAVADSVVNDSAVVKATYWNTPDSVHYATGSTISAHFGFGMSGLWATEGKAQFKNHIGFPGFTVGLRYTYFIKYGIGVTSGLDFNTYRSNIAMGGVMNWSGAKTTYNIPYTHVIDFNRNDEFKSKWSEEEFVEMLEIPLAITYKYKPNKVGFLGTLGMKIAFPIAGYYNYKGNLNHLGSFSQYNYLETPDIHFAGQDEYNMTDIEYRKGIFETVAGSLFGEFGVLVQVHPRIDMSLSIYGSYGVNDINKTPHNERTALGFGTDRNGYAAGDQPVMNTYQGLIGTDAIDHVNPWNLGIKIAVHVNCSKRTDEQKELDRLPAPVAPTVIYIHDTLNQIIRDTITQTEVVEKIIHDTTTLQIQQVTALLQKVIIYYRVNDSEHPIINPTNLLNDAAEIIAANPAIRVSVEGHASSDGNAEANQILSENRALNVAKILIEKGVQDSQIEIHAYGSNHPLKFGKENDRNKDRRVEIIPIMSEVVRN